MALADTKPLALKLQALSSAINEVKHELASSESQNSAAIVEYQIHSPENLGAHLNARRKALGIELATLELQTGVSVSTLKRVFKNPEQVKFSTVLAVCSALGVKLCAVG
jgi:DNA-binding phage protein